jgi:hypothetical protein
MAVSHVGFLCVALYMFLGLVARLYNKLVNWQRLNIAGRLTVFSYLELELGFGFGFGFGFGLSVPGGTPDWTVISVEKLVASEYQSTSCALLRLDELILNMGRRPENNAFEPGNNDRKHFELWDAAGDHDFYPAAIAIGDTGF